MAHSATTGFALLAVTLLASSCASYKALRYTCLQASAECAGLFVQQKVCQDQPLQTYDSQGLSAPGYLEAARSELQQVALVKLDTRGPEDKPCAYMAKLFRTQLVDQLLKRAVAADSALHGQALTLKARVKLNWASDFRDLDYRSPGRVAAVRQRVWALSQAGRCCSEARKLLDSAAALPAADTSLRHAVGDLYVDAILAETALLSLVGKIFSDSAEHLQADDSATTEARRELLGKSEQADCRASEALLRLLAGASAHRIAAPQTFARADSIQMVLGIGCTPQSDNGR